MEKIYLNWDEFIKQYKENKIRPYVSLNLGHALLTSRYAPLTYRIVFKFMIYIILLIFPVSIILFFYLKWWIPIILIIIAFILINQIRKFAAQVVIDIATADQNFYDIAISSDTLILRKTE